MAVAGQMLEPDVTGRMEPGTSVLAAVRRRPLLVLFVTILCAAAAGAASWYLSPPATATTTIGLVAPDSTNVLFPGINGDASLGRYTVQRADFATSDQVLGTVAEATGSSIAELRRRVTVEPSTTANSFVITVSGQSVDQAVNTAQEIVTAYSDATQADVLARGAKASQAYKDAADLHAAALVLSNSKAFGDGVEFIEAATNDNAQPRKIPTRQIVLGGLVGLFLGAVWAWFLLDRDERRVATALRRRPAPPQ